MSELKKKIEKIYCYLGKIFGRFLLYLGCFSILIGIFCRDVVLEVYESMSGYWLDVGFIIFAGAILLINDEIEELKEQLKKRGVIENE